MKAKNHQMYDGQATSVRATASSKSFLAEKSNPFIKKMFFFFIHSTNESRDRGIEPFNTFPAQFRRFNKRKKTKASKRQPKVFSIKKTFRSF